MFQGKLSPAPFLLAVVLLFSGCSPMVVCQVETVIFPDYTCRRATRLEIFPNPRFPQQRPRLADYFQFPPPERYETYAVKPESAIFAGAFDSFDLIPKDLKRATPGTNQLAGNILSFRVMDLVLFVLADFDETLTDIVHSRADGEAAMLEMVRLCIPEVMSVLNARYGAKFDLSRLEAWLYNDLPAKLSSLYAGAWAIHAAKRSAVISPGEEMEYYLFLKAEAKREGLELAEPGTPDLQQENLRRLKEHALRLAEKLCPPRDGGAGPGRETFSGMTADDLLPAIQKAVIARHGSINAFIAKISALVPRAFGAYLAGTVMPIYMLPETTYQYRLRIPGQIIQSNGTREMNGDLVWTFADRDLAFTGQSMWVRSIFVREAVTLPLGLKGFPATLADVDRMFNLCLAPNGMPREALLLALQHSATAHSLAPMEALAGNASSPDAAAAKGMLELFDKHRKNQAAASAAPSSTPQQQPAPTAPAANAAPLPPTTAPAAAGAASPAHPDSNHPLAPLQPLPPAP